MVRRRGIFEIEVIGIPLHCTLCGGTTFFHREVYIDLKQTAKDIPNQLTLQSFACELCSTTQLIQEQSHHDKPNIVYIEVDS
ncbi:hypothetical protein [Sporosarcina sp. P29]|uniref:hypothetical protein n=1 Tax=Sporosarcina sp. P29 TaxID=2048252 RepID=UPI000C171C33|nr:hypothetical protein [Sporosarcina sp. P29]PID00882.1 hypothetical protein CSV68_01275 [Sporosarcina sp. P29]